MSRIACNEVDRRSGGDRLGHDRRFWPAFEEQRRYFRAVTRSGQVVSLGDRRRVFRERWAAIMAELTAA